MNPFDIVNVLNEKNTHEREDIIHAYNPWIINKALANSMDTLLFSEQMNLYYQLPKESQFDFYFHGIPKGKRYSKWFKENKDEEDIINILMQRLYCNRNLAKKYLAMLSDDEKNQMLNMEGGNK